MTHKQPWASRERVWHGRVQDQEGTGGPCPTSSASATQQLQGQQSSFRREQEKALKPLEETVLLFIFSQCEYSTSSHPNVPNITISMGTSNATGAGNSWEKHTGDLSASLGSKRPGFGKTFKYHNSWEFWFYPVLFYLPCLWAWQNWGGEGSLAVKKGQIKSLANTHSPVATRCPGDSEEGAG